MWGFPGVSDGKEYACNEETLFQSLGQEDPLEQRMDTHSSILACCLLTFIKIYQGAGKVVWYSYLFKSFPQFVVIHTVKGVSIVNEVEVVFPLRIPLLFL